MKNKRALLSISVTLGLLAGCAARPATRVRVMSYNIHHGIGMDMKLDLSRTIEAIKAAQPDLVALQEVDRGTNRSRKVDQLQAIAEGTGLQPIFGKTIDFDGGEYGIALLSRLPVDYQSVHPLPNYPKHEKRVLMEIGVRAGGRQVIFYNTDLDDNKDEAERLGSIDVYEQSAWEHKDAPIIFAGDLFVTSEHVVMQRLLASLLDSVVAGHQPRPPSRSEQALQHGDGPPTAPAGYPCKRIDYILYSQHPTIRCVSFQVIPDGVTAQHRPVLAVFEVR